MKALRILSIQQWLKNGLILIPALFAASEWSIELIELLAVSILGFSLLTSAVYINNDLIDLEADRKHPVKCKRLIASGAIEPNSARIFAVLFFSIGITLLILLSWEVAIAGMSYVLLNLVYSSFGKQIPILDLVFISFGYIIRLLIGSFVAEAPLSIWVIVVVCMLSFYLVLLKRHGDVTLYRETGVIARKTVEFYARFDLKKVAFIFIQMIILVYLIYIAYVFGALSNSLSSLAFVTVPLAYLALLRYNKKALSRAKQDPIGILLKDGIALSLLVVSFIILIIALYF